MIHQYGNSGIDVVICRVGNIQEHGTSLHIKVDTWHPAVGLRCGNPPRHLNQLKTREISLNETPSGQELCRPWYIFHEISIETPPPQNKIQISKLIFDTLLRLDVQKPTQALKSVKGPGNTFNWNPKWARTLPSLIYFSWDIYRDPPLHTKQNHNKVDIWHAAVGVRCRNPHRHFSQVKARTLPLT